MYMTNQETFIDFYLLNKNKNIKVPLNMNLLKKFYMKDELNKKIIYNFLKNDEYIKLKEEFKYDIINSSKCLEVSSNVFICKNEIIIEIPSSIYQTIKNAILDDLKKFGQIVGSEMLNKQKLVKFPPTEVRIQETINKDSDNVEYYLYELKIEINKK